MLTRNDDLNSGCLKTIVITRMLLKFCTSINLNGYFCREMTVLFLLNLACQLPSKSNQAKFLKYIPFKINNLFKKFEKFFTWHAYLAHFLPYAK